VIAFMVVAAVLGAPITLDEVRAASRDNLQALQAELDVARADEGIRASRAAIFPQVSLLAQTGASIAGPQRFTTTVPAAGENGALTYEQRSVDVGGSTRGNFVLGLTINQLIYDGGRWWNQIAQSGAQAEAARGQLAEQVLASQFEAERRFFELLRSQQAFEVLKQTVDRSQSQLDRARSLYEAGRGQKRDALDAEVNLGNDQIQVVRSQQAIVSAQVDLLNWLSRPPGEIEAVAPESLKGAPARGPDPAAALTLAREQRPLLKALASQQRSAELAVAVARGAYLPQVSGNLGYTRQSPSADPFFTDPTKQNAINLGLTLRWDVFSGFATQAQVGRASADVRNAGLQEQQAERELAAEIRRASSALDSQLKIAALAERNLKLAEQALKLAEERFNAGASTTLEVRDAQIKLTQTQLTQVQGRIDVEIARAGLGRIVGAPVTAENR
jgi:outer membrane protein